MNRQGPPSEAKRSLWIKWRNVSGLGSAASEIVAYAAHFGVILTLEIREGKFDAFITFLSTEGAQAMINDYTCYQAPPFITSIRWAQRDTFISTDVEREARECPSRIAHISKIGTSKMSDEDLTHILRTFARGYVGYRLHHGALIVEMASVAEALALRRNLLNHHMYICTLKLEVREPAQDYANHSFPFYSQTPPSYRSSQSVHPPAPFLSVSASSTSSSASSSSTTSSAPSTAPCPPQFASQIRDPSPPPTPRPLSLPGPTATIYIGNLPPGMTLQQIVSISAHFGQILFATLVSGKKFERPPPNKPVQYMGFVRFTSVRSAESMILAFANRKTALVVQWGKYDLPVPKEVLDSVMNEGASRCLWIGNLPPGTSDVELRKLFAAGRKPGCIVEARVIEPSSTSTLPPEYVCYDDHGKKFTYGFVHFSTVMTAIDAKTQLDNHKWSACGVPYAIRVRYAKDLSATWNTAYSSKLIPALREKIILNGKDSLTLPPPSKETKESKKIYLPKQTEGGKQHRRVPQPGEEGYNDSGAPDSSDDYERTQTNSDQDENEGDTEEYQDFIEYVPEDDDVVKKHDRKDQEMVDEKEIKVHSKNDQTTSKTNEKSGKVKASKPEVLARDSSHLVNGAKTGGNLNKSDASSTHASSSSSSSASSSSSSKSSASSSSSSSSTSSSLPASLTASNQKSKATLPRPPAMSPTLVKPADAVVFGPPPDYSTSNLPQSLPLQVNTSTTKSAPAASTGAKTSKAGETTGKTDTGDVDAGGGDRLSEFLVRTLRKYPQGDVDRIRAALRLNCVEWDSFLLLQENHLKELEIPLGPRLVIAAAIKKENEQNENP